MKKDEKLGAKVIFGTFISCSLLSLIQIGVVPFLSASIATVASNIIATIMFSLIVVGGGIVYTIFFKDIIDQMKKGKSLKEALDDEDYYEFDNELVDEVIYQTLSNENKKLYDEMIKENSDGVFEKLSLEQIKEVIEVYDSQISDYLNKIEEDINNNDQERVINALILKDRAKKYLNEIETKEKKIRSR